MVQTLNTPKGPLSFPDDWSREQIEAVIAREFPPPKELSWKEVGEQADQSFKNTAEEFGRRLPFHIGARPPGKEAIPLLQTGGDIAGGIGKTLVTTAFHPIRSTVNLAKHVKEDFEQSLSDIAGVTLGQIPGAEEANVFLGGKPGLLAQQRRTAKERLAKAPISTAMNMAAIPGSMFQIPRGLWRLAQAIEGGPAAAKILRAGMSQEEFGAAIRQLNVDAGLPEGATAAQGGANALDVMSQADRDRFVNRYLSTLTRSELAPLRGSLLGREAERGNRQRTRTETAAGLPEGTLNEPEDYLDSIRAANEQTRNRLTASAAEAGGLDWEAQQAQHARNLADLKGRRNAAYDRAYIDGPDIDINDFDEIIGTPLFQEVAKDFGGISDTLAVSRKGKRGAMGNLEFMDRAEQELVAMAKDLGPGSTKGNAAATLAKQIREKLGPMDLPDYHEATALHARVATTPEHPTRTARGPAVPPEIEEGMAENVDIAKARVKMATRQTLDNWRRLPSDLQRAVSRAQVDEMTMGSGLRAEQAFQQTLRDLPPGRRHEFLEWFRRWGPSGGAGGSGAFAFWLAHMAGVSPALIGTAAAVGTAATAARGLFRAARRRKGRRAVNMLLGRENMQEAIDFEPLSWLDYINMGYPVAASGGQNLEEEHH